MNNAFYFISKALFVLIIDIYLFTLAFLVTKENGFIKKLR